MSRGLQAGLSRLVRIANTTTKQRARPALLALPRQTEQLVAQRLRAALAELRLELVLRSLPCVLRSTERAHALLRQVQRMRARITLGYARRDEPVALQRLERAQQRRAVHHQRIGELAHQHVRPARQGHHDRELRRRYAERAQVAFVDLRDESRRLTQREAIARTTNLNIVHELQFICAYA